MNLVEHVCTFRLPDQRVHQLRESAMGDDLPSVIYPDIRVLTANKITRNKTYYSEASLRGNPQEGTGLVSFNRPYPIPVIKDHDMSTVDNTYGRIIRPVEFVSNGHEGYVRAIATITNPVAIRAVLSGEFMTVSLGSITHSVECSVCSQELTEELCEHDKGQTYEVAGRQMLCFWKIGEIQARELSFVLAPSDTDAGVLSPNLEESCRESAGNLNRLVGATRRGTFDLLNGACLSEHYLPQSPYVAQRGNFRFRGF